MHEVTVSRPLPAPLADVEALLTPTTILEYEGKYRVQNAVREDERTVVTAWPNGRLLAPRYVFEATEDGFAYRPDADSRSLDAGETILSLAARDDATEITLRATCDPALPIPFLGRYLAWRRQRALVRLCDQITNALG